MVHKCSDVTQISPDPPTFMTYHNFGIALSGLCSKGEQGCDVEDWSEISFIADLGRVPLENRGRDGALTLLTIAVPTVKGKVNARV